MSDSSWRSGNPMPSFTPHEVHSIQALVWMAEKSTGNGFSELPLGLLRQIIATLPVTSEPCPTCGQTTYRWADGISIASGDAGAAPKEEERP